MDSKYKAILDTCSGSMAEVSGGRIGRLARTGCTEVSCYWKHWVCVLPQHGPGRKHFRRIALEPWQEAVVQDHPKEFIKGLIHSDGCRVTNRVTNGHSKEQPRRYEYPRYFFTNRSRDIRGLFVWACSLIRVETRQSNHQNISVAKRESVAILDSFIGPKR